MNQPICSGRRVENCRLIFRNSNIPCDAGTNRESRNPQLWARTDGFFEFAPRYNKRKSDDLKR